MTLPLSLGNTLHPQRSLIFDKQLSYTPSDNISPRVIHPQTNVKQRPQSAAALIKGCNHSSRMGASCSTSDCSSTSRVVIQTSQSTTSALSKSAWPSYSSQTTMQGNTRGDRSTASDTNNTLPSANQRREADLSQLALQFKMSPAATAIAADRRANRAYAAARLELLAAAPPPSTQPAKVTKAHAGPHLLSPAYHPQRIPDLLHALPPRLKHLSLLSCDAAGASSLAHLSRFGQLRRLELHSLRLSDAKLARLQPLVGLTALTVVCPVSRQGNQGVLREVAASFGGLAGSLVSLHLTNCR